MEDSKLERYGSYHAWQAQEGTWFISFMNGRQCMYLLEGEQKAMLIDTGYGAGGLRSLVGSLTDKPVMVVNTHFHRDHAGGNGEFEEVFMSPGALIDRDEWMAEDLPFDLTKLQHPDYRQTFLHDGDLIDLGGRVIEVMDVRPAHCNSSLFFLDRTKRMLFCGDEIESGQVLMYVYSLKPVGNASIRERLENMRANTQLLLSRSGEFDWLLPCHNGFPIAKSYLDDFIGLVDSFFGGTATVEERLGHPVIDKLPLGKLLCRVRYGKASIFMAREDVRQLYGSKPE